MSEPLDCSQTYCVVGAGASGLTALKNLLAEGLAAEAFERADEVGGNWYYDHPRSSVYASTHLISSKKLTEYPDFPMPDNYPAYPSHRQIWDYFRAYARHFGLYERIRFNTAIERIEPAGQLWLVTLGSGERRLYRGVVVANGHHWDPLVPKLPGSFSGLAIHSQQYKTPEVLRGRRVLVIGAGNSGCDIAVESAQNAAQTFHSLRRGYHYIPKFVFGRPTDEAGEILHRWRLPLWLRRLVTAVVVRTALGPPERYGLPRADHKLLETHPIVNSQLLYYVGHGEIHVKPDVAELCGSQVRFVDRSLETIDVLVYATGFRVSFPFIDRAYLQWHGERPNLYLNVFHPRYDNFCVCGMIQPDSGLFGLAHFQARLIARFFSAVERGAPAAERFRREKKAAGPDLGQGIRYLDSSRHAIEVEHYGYRRLLERQIARFA